MSNIKKTLILFFLLSIFFPFTLEKGFLILSASEKIDINESPREQLQEITGIGPTLAERIIEKRPFHSLNDLTRVEGIGEVTLENIKKENIKKISLPNQKTKKEEIGENPLPIKKNNFQNEKNPFSIFITSFLIAIFYSFVIVILKIKIIKK